MLWTCTSACYRVSCSLFPAGTCPALGTWRARCLSLRCLTQPSVLLSVLFLPQDPTNLDKFNVSSFFHVKNNMRMIDPGMDT